MLGVSYGRKRDAEEVSLPDFDGRECRERYDAMTIKRQGHGRCYCAGLGSVVVPNASHCKHKLHF